MNYTTCVSRPETLAFQVALLAAAVAGGDGARQAGFSQAQVATQLAISKESDLFDWGGEIPKGAVVVGSPNNDQISIVAFHLDQELTENWKEQLLPKAFFYYFNGVLPRLGRFLAPLPVITGRTSTPLPIMKSTGNEEPFSNGRSDNDMTLHRPCPN